VINANEVWYEDLMGSGAFFNQAALVVKVNYEGVGIETVSHVRENGRITLLFCALSGPPRIVRLFGRGVALYAFSRLIPSPAFYLATVHEFGTSEYNALIDPATRQPSSRSIILIHVWKVGTVNYFLLLPRRATSPGITPADAVFLNFFIFEKKSCGWGVPLFEFKGQRTTHPRWAVKTQNRDFDFETNKGGPSEVREDEYPEKGIRYYQALVNQKSLDGLPGLLDASDISGEEEVASRNPTINAVKSQQRTKGKRLFAFIFGLIVATYLPPIVKATGSNLAGIFK
jgi:hypothetical protein